MPSCSASALDGRPEALVAQHDRLELEGEVAQGTDRLPLLLERRPEHLLRLVGPVLLDRVDDAVEHERDARHRLHWAVVEEERQPAPLLLLGRDQLVGEPCMLGLEPLDLLFHPLVLMALGEEQHRPRGRDRKGEAEQRQPVLLDRDADHPDERAGDDQRDK